MNNIIAITTGDIDGIGAEVAGKALRKIGPQKNIQFHVYIQSKKQEDYFRGLKSKFSSARIKIIIDRRSPAKWVEEAVHLQMQKKISGLVTGPLSKPEIFRAGLSDLGHTEIIKRVTKSKSAYMFFLGKVFHVALVSGHLPIRSVAEVASAQKIIELSKLVYNVTESLTNQKRPLAVLGLNPHAGDGGLIGHEETAIKDAISKIRQEGISVEGPLVPDVAFQKNQWKKYSSYIAQYHDQGLIPFKLVHGHSGAHMTLGVPIIRTSVDHGVAHDIFGKNMAQPHSMIDAIKLCVQLVRSSHV